MNTVTTARSLLLILAAIAAAMRVDSARTRDERNAPTDTPPAYAQSAQHDGDTLAPDATPLYSPIASSTPVNLNTWLTPAPGDPTSAPQLPTDPPYPAPPTTPSPAPYPAQPTPTNLPLPAPTKSPSPAPPQ